MMPAPGGERQVLLPTSESEAKKRVGVCTLVVIGFFWVSGGLYGNETMVSSAPPLIVFLWTVLAGLCFALPNALMTAELATAFPVDGGQVVWTAEACGPRIGGHNCFWVWFTNLLDAAVYPQIAAKYVSKALNLGLGSEQGICLAMVVCVAVTNCMGLDWVTASQSVVFFLSLTPSLIFIVIGLGRLEPEVLTSMEGETDWALLISWALWLYSGFSTLGAMAGEVENAKYTYPAVVAFLLPLVIALNVMPFAVALSLDPDTAHYDAGYFGTLAGQLSGLWLKTLFVVGANMAQVGLYHSQVIAAERSCGAFVNAYLGDLGFTCLLPLNREAPPPPRLTPRMNEPPLVAAETPLLHRRCWASFTLWLKTEPEGGGMSRANVLFNATIAGCLTQVHLAALVEVEMMLFACSHCLFLYSFIALRVQRPNVERPFQLPGGVQTAVCYCLLPFCFAVSALLTNLYSSWENTVAFVLILLIGALGHCLGSLMRWRIERAKERSPDVAYTTNATTGNGPSLTEYSPRIDPG